MTDNVAILKYAHFQSYVTIFHDSKVEADILLQDTETALRIMLVTQGKKPKCLFHFGNRREHK